MFIFAKNDGMDILRKELNSIYASQQLDQEQLPDATVTDARSMASTVMKVSNGCAVITDAARDRCYIYPGGFGLLMRFAESQQQCIETGSSDEDDIYARIHPEDLVEKRMLEYEFFKMVDALTPDKKTFYKATCRLRMKDGTGMYRLVENSTQALCLSPAGKIWLILCCYNLSALPSCGTGITPCIVSNLTGEVTSLTFETKRKQILTEREKEILRLIQDGRPSKQIAALLDISVNTVNRHRQNIIEKLSVGNSIEAVTAANAMKLL